MHMQGRSQLSTKDYEKQDSWTFKDIFSGKNRWDMQTWGFMIDIFWRLEGLGVKTAQHGDVLKFLPAENDEFQVQFIFSDFQWSIFQLKILWSEVSWFEVMSPTLQLNNQRLVQLTLALHEKWEICQKSDVTLAASSVWMRMVGVGKSGHLQVKPSCRVSLFMVIYKVDLAQSPWSLHVYEANGTDVNTTTRAPGNSFDTSPDRGWDDSVSFFAHHRAQHQHHHRTRMKLLPPKNPLFSALTGGDFIIFHHQLSSGTPQGQFWGSSRWFWLWSGPKGKKVTRRDFCCGL